MRYLYIDGTVVLKKDIYSTESIIKVYPLLAKKFGLVQEETAYNPTEEFSSENIETYMISKKLANIRVSPSIKYEPIRTVDYGYEVLPVMYQGKVIQENKFTKIHFEGAYAWLFNSLINKKRN